MLRSWGYEPVVGPNVGKVNLRYYAGTPEERQEDFLWALRDGSIKAILFSRGGYGAIHLIDRLPLEEFSANPKWLIGFSDITTFHQMAAKAGIMSIHGTMCSFMAPAEGKDISSTVLRDILSGVLPRYELPAGEFSREGKACGKLMGGNFCTLAATIGSSACALDQDGIILFLEDDGETFHNLDRLINMFIHYGVLDRCKGVILGDFTDCKDDLGYGSVPEMFNAYLKDYPIPVFCGFPAGHGKVNLPLILGAETSLEVRDGKATIEFKGID